MSTITRQSERMLSQWEADNTLLEQSAFARRVEVLDQLDLFLTEVEATGIDVHLLSRARALASRLEAANSRLYSSIRDEIRSGICPDEFQRILGEGASQVQCGLNYDHLDDLLAGVFQFDPPSEEPRTFNADSVFYQPTPARHIFHLISAAAITAADTLIDLGSGLGHVPLLVSACTGATAIGIELDPAWVESVRKCADALKLRTVSFLAQDAREADLSAGTAFYLYTPFTGATLASVLNSIREQAALRPIRICTFGPCTATVAQEPWLAPDTRPDTEQITVFRSTP